MICLMLMSSSIWTICLLILRDKVKVYSISSWRYYTTWTSVRFETRSVDNAVVIDTQVALQYTCCGCCSSCLSLEPSDQLQRRRCFLVMRIIIEKRRLLLHRTLQSIIIIVTIPLSGWRRRLMRRLSWILYRRSDAKATLGSLSWSTFLSSAF